MVYTYFAFGFGGLGVVLALATFLVKSKRGSLGTAAVAALAAGVAARYESFPVLALAGMTVPWALFVATHFVDAAWRVKVGFCVFLGLASALCLYPTYVDERFDRPDYDPNASVEAQAAYDAEGRKGNDGFGRFFRANVPFRLVRGLDLKGGNRVEYTVDVQEAIRDKRDRYYEDLKTAIGRKWGIVAEDGFVVTEEQNDKLRAKAKFEKPRTDVSKINVVFATPEDADVVNDELMARFVQELSVVRDASDKTKLSFNIKKETAEAERKSAVAQAKDKILRRVDSLGLKEASVSIRDEDIVIEVPGQDRRQFEDIKALVSQTARLEFKMVDDEADAFAAVRQNCPTCQEEGIEWMQENAPLGPGKTEARWFPILRSREGEPANDTFKRFKAWAEKAMSVPDTHQIAFEKEVRPRGDGSDETYWRAYYLNARADVTGDMIRKASREREQKAGGVGGWLVALEFSPRGAEQFERVTGANIKKRFAILLDEKIESAPVINQKIAGGGATITMGAGNLEEQLKAAGNLELVLKSGALPAPIVYKGEQQIGPSLGTDAIVQGLKGGAFGALLVFFVMLVIYARAGFVAIVAVIFNMVLQVAVLAMLGASMTLPGIAGLALTIGIAVDANVLINERIRDELRAGKSPRQAVDIGYDRAFSAIVDGHVTTFIAGVILGTYGSGPIKGFAVTLIIGMVVSMFTGVVCTRLVFDWVVRWRKAKVLSLG